MSIPNANLDSFNRQLAKLSGPERDTFQKDFIEQLSQGVAWATALTQAAANALSNKRLF